MKEQTLELMLEVDEARLAQHLEVWICGYMDPWVDPVISHLIV